ncbi:MAG: glycosyltransferase family 4 protein [Methylocystis sp.]|uniref:glycosyltransferase family 4 protein n=1 Tax=Methylocystis sp. TaxID=1911079 RepID=UPI003DA38EBD
MTKKSQKTVAIIQTQAENAGAQEIARQLASGFEARGWRTRQIFFFRRTASFDRDDNVFFCAAERPRSIPGVLQTIRALHGELRRQRPDAVVTLQHYGNVIAAPVARLAGARLIIANQLSAPEVIPRGVALVDKALGTIGAYDHIVVNSAQTAAAYSAYPAPYARRVTRIDHGFIDKSAALSRSDARERLGLPPDVTLLGCAARLCPLKQLDLAIALLPRNERQHLALAGQGPDRARLEHHAQALGVRERVHFLGELDKTALGAFLAALDCFVFPSAAETFGLAPVEAAQAGVPVVANDLDVLREVLAVDGAPCALFVDARDTAAFAGAVGRVLGDSATREALTATGRRLVERYPLEAMIDQFMRLMETPST